MTTAVKDSMVDYRVLRGAKPGDQYKLCFKKNGTGGVGLLFQIMHLGWLRLSSEVEDTLLSVVRTPEKHREWRSPGDRFVVCTIGDQVSASFPRAVERQLGRYLERIEVLHRDRPLVDLDVLNLEPGTSLICRFKDGGEPSLGAAQELLKLCEDGALVIADPSGLEVSVGADEWLSHDARQVTFSCVSPVEGSWTEYWGGWFEPFVAGHLIYLMTA